MFPIFTLVIISDLHKTITHKTITRIFKLTTIIISSFKNIYIKIAKLKKQYASHSNTVHAFTSLIDLHVKIFIYTPYYLSINSVLQFAPRQYKPLISTHQLGLVTLQIYQVKKFAMTFQTHHLGKLNSGSPIVFHFIFVQLFFTLFSNSHKEAQHDMNLRFMIFQDAS